MIMSASQIRQRFSTSSRATEREGGGNARSYSSSLVRKSLSLDRVWGGKVGEGMEAANQIRRKPRRASEGFRDQRGLAEKEYDGEVCMGAREELWIGLREDCAPTHPQHMHREREEGMSGDEAKGVNPGCDIFAEHKPFADVTRALFVIGC